MLVLYLMILLYLATILSDFTRKRILLTNEVLIFTDAKDEKKQDSKLNSHEQGACASVRNSILSKF